MADIATRKQIWYRIGVIFGAVVAFVVLIGGAFVRSAVKSEAYQQAQADLMAEAEKSLAELYSDAEIKVPKEAVVKEQIDAVAERLTEIKSGRQSERKAQVEEKLALLGEFVQLREQLEGYFEKGVLKADVTAEDLQVARTGLAALPESYAKVLQGKVDQMQVQYDAIKDLKATVRAMFTDDAMTVVSPKLTRARYREVVAQVEKLPQRELAKSYEVTLTKVEQVLTQREKEAAEARRRALEAKRRAEELRKQQQKEEAAAWKILNVPYHSQNQQKIYNGCEAASLLMALQYKGYLKGVDLHKYAEMMPKSDDYNTGFVGSIYDLQPKTYVHWIAPAPLAKFGRESSGNTNVVDISGASLTDLDKEVVAGNPVIIYVTFLFNPAKPWANGAPGNLHVVLLTGYNTKTGTQRLTDPWTQSGGGRTYDIPKAELEKIYNAVGKRAVVVR